jgi:hypothetical protein
MKDPSTVVERLVLEEPIRANSVYGEWSQKAQELFDSGADSGSKEYRDLVTEFESFKPEEMVVTGPCKIDKDSITESRRRRSSCTRTAYPPATARTSSHAARHTDVVPRS